MSVKLKRILAAAVLIILLNALVIMPIAAVIVYESIFGERFETEPYFTHSPSDFEGLCCERSDFLSDGVTLAGYKYSMADTPSRGVVVMAHGYGGGGHNAYMPFAYEFARAGFAVFAYDARGNDNSGGSSVGGLVRGVIDLDNALIHVKSAPEYNGLPIMLFGHSWGAYSAGSVMALHTDIAACVMVAGFNESEDMIAYESKGVVGPLASLTLPYVYLYESFKFGEKYSSLSALSGTSATDARVMVVQSMDDVSVPPECGYEKLYAAYSDNERFTFVTYEDRGHDRILYSRKAEEYRAQLNLDYTEYVESHGGEYSAEIKAEFMSLYLDKSACFEPDAELIGKMIALFDAAIQSVSP